MKKGDTIGRFTLLKELGHGGMGGVFIGFDPESNALVAVKTLFEEYSEDELYVRRFQRECEVLQRLDDPHIVRFIEHGCEDRIYFMVLEHIRGRTVTEVLKQRNRLGIPEALDLAEGVGKALAHAHGKRIIHRDVKPSNIMITDEGKIAKVLDFGVAYADDSLLHTATGDIVGTFMYSAPEQNQGKEVDERSDLYALGLVFYEALTGQRALQGNTHQEVTTVQLTSSIPPPSEVFSGVPGELDAIVLKLLAFEPDDRYQSAEQFLFDLQIFKNNPESFTSTQKSVYDYPEFVEQFKKANTAFRARNFDLALDIATDLATKAPKAAEVYFLLGQIQYQKSFVYNAIREYKRALTFDAQNVGYHLELAMTYSSLGMLSQARQEYEVILEIEPCSPVALAKLEELDGIESGAVAPVRPRANSKVREVSLEDIKAIQRRLLHRLGPVHSPAMATLSSLIIWAGGYVYLGRRTSFLLVLILQGVLFGLVLFLFFVPDPYVFVSQHPALAALVPNDPDLKQAVLYGGIALYVLLWLRHLFRVRRIARLGNLQAFVVEKDEDGRNVTINAGENRGIVRGQIFYVFQRQEKGGDPVFVGEIHVHDTKSTSASGLFQPQPHQRVFMGDVCVHRDAVREGLFDPRRDGREAFLDIPREFLESGKSLTKDEWERYFASHH